MSNRDIAKAALDSANDNAGEAQVSDYPATMALAGIGYALLDLGDIIRGALEAAQ